MVQDSISGFQTLFRLQSLCLNICRGRTTISPSQSLAVLRHHIEKSLQPTHSSPQDHVTSPATLPLLLSATLAFLLFLRYASHTPSSEPLHWPFPLPNIFLQTSSRPSSLCSYSAFSMSLLCLRYNHSPSRILTLLTPPPAPLGLSPQPLLLSNLISTVHCVYCLWLVSVGIRKLLEDRGQCSLRSPTYPKCLEQRFRNRRPQIGLCCSEDGALRALLVYSCLPCWCFQCPHPMHSVCRKATAQKDTKTSSSF